MKMRMPRIPTGFIREHIRGLLVGILVPLAIIAVYFAALGGAGSREARLPVLLVNNDQMVEQANKDGSTTQVVAGRLLVSWLTNPEHTGDYDWRLASAETAAADLKAGRAYAAVEIPADFSESIVSLSGGSPKAAQVRVTVNQSADFLTGELTDRVFSALTAQFGQTVTKQVAVGLADGVNQSAQGYQDAADGAGKLADGAGQLRSGFAQYADGVRSLRDGAGALADGSAQFSGGANDFSAGVGQYVDGVNAYSTGVDEFAGGAGDLAGGAQQFAGGVSPFVGGVDQYLDGVRQYVDGAGQYADGIGQYVDGARQYVGGVNEYVDGVARLANGLTQLDTGSDDLGKAAGQLGQVADELTANQDQINQGIALLQRLRDQLASLENLDPAALGAYCDQIPDPAAAASCHDSVAALVDALHNSGIDYADSIQKFSDLVDQLGGLANAGPMLRQLADGLTQYTDGVHQLTLGAGELSAGGDKIKAGGATLTTSGSQLVDGGDTLKAGGTDLVAGAADLRAGGSQLAAGASTLSDGAAQLQSGVGQLQDGGAALRGSGGQLVSGAAQLATGANDLGSGVAQLRDGGTELVDNSTSISGAITQLRDGAATMQQSLQDGADQAKNAIGDTEAFANTVAAPVTASVTNTHMPGFGGVLAALLVPIGIWLAGLVTMLQRSLISGEALASSASGWSMLLHASRQLGQPVLIVAVLMSLGVHALLRVPWTSIGITLLFALLASLLVVAVHLLLAAAMRRRLAVLTSIILLAVQLVLVRGFLPIELRNAWVGMVAGLSGIGQVANGMQAGYAGGTVALVLGPVLILLLMMLAADVAATAVLSRRRHALAVQQVHAAVPMTQPNPKPKLTPTPEVS